MTKQPYVEVPYDAPDNASGAHMHYQAETDEEKSSPEAARRWYLEGDMGKRILGIVVALLVVYLLYYAYQRHLATQAAEGAIKVEDTGAATASSDADTPAPAPKPRAAVQNLVTSTTPAATPMAAPATDSIQPNPPNGAAFAGTGKFQVYRQGNLTWRVDTESGATCILFATMDEWKKPVVYNHACGNS